VSRFQLLGIRLILDLSLNIRNKTLHRVTMTLALTALVLSGCSVPSDELSTDQIGMDVTVTGENNQTFVSVELDNRGPKFENRDVVLTDGDRLIANIDNQDINLRFVGDQTFPEYIGVFDQNREDAEVKVILDRPVHDNAIAEVIMPRPLFITSPTSGESFGTADIFSISWTPINTEESLNLRFRLECDRENSNSRSSFHVSFNVEDTGFHSLPVSEIKPADFQMEPAVGSVCDVEIQLDYRSDGSFVGESLGSVNVVQVARQDVQFLY